MMNSLEALERIETTFAYNKKREKNCYRHFLSESKVVELYYKDYNLVKQDLELKDQLEKENQELKQDVKDVLEDYKDAATIMFKLDKAIEILKKFNFKLGQYGNGEYYILIYYAGITIELILTQEEYDLLKGVLEC